MTLNYARSSHISGLLRPTFPKELENHQKQIENAAEVEQFLKDKFSNQELYTWMKEQLFVVYKQAYNLVYEMAKKAEKAAAKQTKTASAMAEAYSMVAGQGKPAGGGPLPPKQGFSMDQAGDFLKKNWMWVALGVLLVFGNKIFKPKRRAPRRRAAKPKTVIRYRTRKAPARRRRR